jgi:hypothetical protein
MSEPESASEQAAAAYQHINRDNWTLLAVGADKRPLGKWSPGEPNRYNYQNALEVFDRAARVQAFGLVAGPSGLIIIDLDSDEAIRLFHERFGKPDTRIVKTPRGRHLYYQAPAGLTLGPSTDLLPGIDVRAGESYAILPPSVTDGGKYEWANDLPIAELSGSILDLLRSRQEEPRVTPPGERIKEGTRNDTLWNRALLLVRAGMDDESVFICIRAIASEQADGTLNEAELRGIVKSARTFHERNPRDETTEGPSQIRTVCFADMPAPEAVDWVAGEHLHGRFPVGELTMIYGDPGVGKGSITVSLISEITATGGRVLISSPEDDPIRVVKPRLIAAGADLRSVSIIDSVRPTGAMSIDLATEHDRIINAAVEYGANVIVLDPIGEHLSADVKNERDNREALGPYLQACREHRIATIAVGHTNRTAGGSGYMRAGGSSALYKIARSAFIAGLVPAPAEDGDAKRNVALAHGKTNLGKKMPTLIYEINTEELAIDAAGKAIYTSRAVFVGESNLEADEILDERKINDHARISECAAWLRDYLDEHLGASAKNEVETAAKQTNSEWTPAVLKRALGTIGGKMARRGFGGAFVYQSADYVPHDGT